MADELVKLIDCMEKAAGTRMPDEIKTSILARARAIMDEQGLKPIAASRAALGEYLGAVQQDIAQVEAAMKPPPQESVEAKYAKMVAGPPDKEDYLYHAAHPGLKDKILTEGTAPGSWFAKTPQESGAFAGDVRADKAYFRVKKQDVKDIPAGQEDVFGQEFQKAGIFRRSSEGHQVEEVDQYGNPIKAGEATSLSQQQVKAEQTDNLDKFLKAVEREREEESVKLRAVASPQAVQAATQAKAVAAEVKDFISKLPKADDFTLALRRWAGINQESAFEVLQMNKEINKEARTPLGREGITNNIQAGGDPVLLGQRAQASKNKDLKKGYMAGMNLTPEEQTALAKVNKYYANYLAEGRYWGIPIKEIKDYVTQIWDLGEATTSGIVSPKKLTEYFRFSRPRTFENFFEGEQAGYKPKTKDITALLSIYATNLKRAINSRRFVQELSKGKAADGNPLLAPGGNMEIVTDTGGPVPMSKEAALAAGKGAYLVFPDSMPLQAKLKDLGYKSVDQPALKTWVWKGKDPQGNPIFMQSDLLVHPDIYRHLKNVLGQSLIRQWWATPTENPFERIAQRTTQFLLDDLQSGMKATMFSLSPFHQVQEGTHAVGHRVNPFTDIPEIRLAGPNADPKQIDAVRHGLKLSADRLSQDQFIEGMGTNQKNFITRALRKWGGKAGAWLSDRQDLYTDYLFERYIPGLKFKTYEHILARNTKRFEKDIASGKVQLSQVKMRSADQSNAAYGHLNYAAIGRNQTLQHIAQIGLLAPDFFEARARFVGQAIQGIPGMSRDPRVGLEQLHALLLLAALQFAIAQIVNMLIHNGEFDAENALKHPFDIIAGNKRYGLRSVPGDLLHLGTDLYDIWTGRAQGSSFVQGRLSPLVGKSIGQILFGVNYRKEPVTLHEAVIDMAAGTIPLPFQGLTRGLTSKLTTTSREDPISWFEKMMGAGGIVIHRVSPLTEIYPMARAWMKENHPQQLDVHPVSKYKQLQFALEDSDDNQALIEAQALQNSGMTAKAIVERFRESMMKTFTGSSLENEKEFYLSLDAYDRAKYDAALERRAVIIQRFDKLIPSGAKPITRQTLLNRIFKQ